MVTTTHYMVYCKTVCFNQFHSWNLGAMPLKAFLFVSFIFVKYCSTKLWIKITITQKFLLPWQQICQIYYKKSTQFYLIYSVYYAILQNYMWASEDADQPAHHWSILWQCHIWSHWKKCIKSQVKETFKFALFGHSYKMFHLTLKLCPRWWSAPAPCLCTCIKSRKNCIEMAREQHALPRSYMFI